MALILEYAIQNDICRKIISAYEYKVSPMENNPQADFYEQFFLPYVRRRNARCHNTEGKNGL
ncbi:MAG: hypothetical protein K2I80_08680 [Ruminococcus sp.]|nr:hypothetical protein [Ruminococcus sp.]